MKKIKEFSEPAGYMRVRQVRVREIADDEPIPTGAVVLPGNDKTEPFDWRQATEKD